MIAHNDDDIITDLYYYEIKTRLNPKIKEGAGSARNYITVIAHNSLLKDEESPTEAIADFLMREYIELGQYDQANKYKDIVLYPNKYNKNFELFFIIEKGNFVEEIVSELHSLPPTLNPLNVTIIYIDNLNELVENCWENLDVALTKIIQTT
jgi:hypothetical protein